MKQCDFSQDVFMATYNVAHLCYICTYRYIYKMIDHSSYRLPPPPGCPRKVYQTMMNCWWVKLSLCQSCHNYSCTLFDCMIRHPAPDLRPSFSVLLLDLQHPDFKLLTWTPEDVAAYTEQARTLGAPLEA